jgi:hypothetical protein
MPSIGVSREEFLAELEALGETEVRIRLINKTYTDINEKAAFAREWVHRKELARTAVAETRNEALTSAQLDAALRASAAAERAADAAERSARAAEKPNTRATIANIIASVALVMTTVLAINTIFPMLIPWLFSKFF